MEQESRKVPKEDKKDYEKLLLAIDSISLEIGNICNSLTELRQGIIETGYSEEECPDEKASEEAMVKALEGICLDMMAHTQEPEGDA